MLRERGSEADIIHVHDARAHTLAAMFADKPFVVSRRVAFPLQRGWLSKWKYRRAKRFLAVSHFVAEQLMSGGIAREKIDIVPDGVPMRKADDGTRGQQEFTAVALATRDRQKGRELVEAAAAMSKVPVRFSEDLDEDLARAAVFVYATRSEGLGSAALLAMSLGVPVVASRVGGLPEVVLDGYCGLLVENDAARIAEALQAMRENPDGTRSMGRNARRHVEANFTDKLLVERTLASYRRALET
jgi:phosphohistidine swiveling domain-containing protein